MKKNSWILYFWSAPSAFQPVRATRCSTHPAWVLGQGYGQVKHAQARKELHMYSQLIDFFHVVCLCTSWPVYAEGGLVIFKSLTKLTFDPECINMRCKAVSTRHFDKHIT